MFWQRLSLLLEGQGALKIGYQFSVLLFSLVVTICNFVTGWWPQSLNLSLFLHTLDGDLSGSPVTLYYKLGEDLINLISFYYIHYGRGPWLLQPSLLLYNGCGPQ